MQPLPETPEGPLVSAPERALLGLLDEGGRDQSIEEARNIMECVRTPRLDLMGTLLKYCPSVKVVRLCLQWAEEARMPAGPRDYGRWGSKLPNGSTLILKPHCS